MMLKRFFLTTLLLLAIFSLETFGFGVEEAGGSSNDEAVAPQGRLKHGGGGGGVSLNKKGAPKAGGSTEQTAGARQRRLKKGGVPGCNCDLNCANSNNQCNDFGNVVDCDLWQCSC